MFIEVNANDDPNLHVLYSVTTGAGELIHLGIASFNQMVSLPDMKAPLPVEKAYITVIHKDVDRLKLANKAVMWLEDKDRDDLREHIADLVKSWQGKAVGKRIECIDTGETFPSAASGARAHDLTYTALIRHLNGEKGFKSVKGRTYRWV